MHNISVCTITLRIEVEILFAITRNFNSITDIDGKKIVTESLTRGLPSLLSAVAKAMAG